MEFHCPKCNSLIYSRKNKLCGKCGEPLPKELLLSDEQVRHLKQKMQEEEKRAARFKGQFDFRGGPDSQYP